ncbi:MAG: hypothetical protein HQ402_02835 [Parcubacteria group bacterium]|nr:hypothetical protein [Parcubacteria group bacterium]
MYWVNFLHLYQPPTQNEETLTRIIDESYRLIIKLLHTYPNLKLTLNISGSLLDLLEKYKHEDIINELKGFVEEQRIELVGSAMYHPILPLLPAKEVDRQIKLNSEICKKFFGSSYNPSGFFLPEMAYSKEVADVIKENGFSWIILDELHLQEKVDPSVRYTIKDNGLVAIFRNREISRMFPPEYIIKDVTDLHIKYLITAHDGEMYGHWHKEDHGFYEKVFTSKYITTITASEYVKMLSTEKEIVPRQASWESTLDELEQNIYYGLWYSPKNKIHKKLWELLRFANAQIDAHEQDKNYIHARKHFDKGLASCSWWWASGKKLDVWRPEIWNPSEIEKGAQELLNTVRSLDDNSSKDTIKAEKLYNQIRDIIWEKHWKNTETK